LIINEEICTIAPVLSVLSVFTILTRIARAPRFAFAKPKQSEEECSRIATLFTGKPLNASTPISAISAISTTPFDEDLAFEVIYEKAR
jgi:hypothetical protein